MNDDPHLLHLSLCMNINLLTCEQIKINSILQMIDNYEFNLKFDIQGLLDASTLLLCMDKKTNQQFALKILLVDEFDEFIGLYLKSIECTSDINKIIDIIYEKEFVFILFEAATGDLHSYLKEKSYLDEHETLYLFWQIVRIVDRLHTNGIILNDLKLRKFVFKDLGRKLLKLETLDGASDGTCKNKFNYGNVLYQSPERLQGHHQATVDNSKASDCWSLGIILYTLLFRKYPFYHSDLDLLKNQILTIEPNLPANLPLQIRSLLTALLNKNDQERPTTGELLKSELFESMSFTDLNVDLNGVFNDDNFNDNNLTSKKEYCQKLSNLIRRIRKSIEPEYMNKKKEIYMNYNLKVPIINYNSNSKINEFNHSKVV